MSLAKILASQLRAGACASRGAPVVPSGQMPLSETVHSGGQEIDEAELEDTGCRQRQHWPEHGSAPQESEQTTGLSGPQSRVTLTQRSSMITFEHSVFSSAHCSQASELEEERADVEETDEMVMEVLEDDFADVEEMVMEVLEDETGAHSQHVPWQESTPQIPLHDSTNPGQHSRMRCTHMRSRTVLLHIVCPGSHCGRELETEEMATEMLELCEPGQQHVRLLPEDEAEEPPGTDELTEENAEAEENTELEDDLIDDAAEEEK